MPGCPCAFGQRGLLPGFEPRTAPQPGGEAQSGNIAYVINQHAKSLAFSQLGATTQQHYRDYAKAIKVFPLKSGSKLGDAVVDRLSPESIRRLIDIIAQGRPGTKPGDAAIPGYPTKANHWLSYLRRVFGWAHIRSNPVDAEGASSD